jgi:hypothetical protein
VRHAVYTPAPFPQDIYPGIGGDEFPSGGMRCAWLALRAQLLAQWNRLTPRELDEAGPDRERLARLIQTKYGIACELAENYLRNFERTLPVM